jgi:hypothetical protein
VINPGGAPVCLGLVAQTSFTWGLCSCKNVSFEDNALVDGWNSTYGPYKPGQLGGGVGANGEISSASGADIWGQSWAASTATAFSGAFTIHYNLESGGDVSANGLSVTHDAYVAGNISGDMTVGGTLYQPAGKAHAGLTPVNQAVTVPDPCNCSSPIPVANYVTYAATNNDDASIGLDPTIMTQANHPPRIDLPCGVYYMQGFSSGGLIVAHGHTALFINGSVSSSSPLQMTVADGMSTFDIYVSGTITTTDSFTLGNPSYPALTRLYVGSSQALDIQASLIVGAEIWAGNAQVNWESGSALFGALFAGNFQGLSRVVIHQDQGIDYAGSGCPPMGGGGTGTTGGTSTGGTGGTDGGGTSMCTTCTDCGNQACVRGTCGSCTTSSDCCSPLVCQNGTCVPLVAVY